MRKGSVIGLAPRYGQRSEPQMHVADNLTMASVGFWIVGSATSSHRTSRGAYMIVPSIIGLHLLVANMVRDFGSERQAIEPAGDAFKCAALLVGFDNKAFDVLRVRGALRLPL